MSATEKLRALLDERGVDWESGDFIEPNAETQWGNNRYMDYPELPPYLTISNCTPEQAIAATLGRGECEMEWVSDWIGWHCKACDSLRQGLPDQKPNYCPNCGRRVVE